MKPRTPDHKAWISKLPKSKMVLPQEFSHRLKYLIWTIYSPIHPKVRDGALAFRVVKKRGRQEYLLGTIAPGLSIEEFVACLVDNGYAYHRIAWEDDDEVVSLRHVENFTHQYHIRIYEDREVRGHYEHTPECHPLLHLFEVDREDRRQPFLDLVGERLIPHTSDDRSDHEWGFLVFSQRRREQTLRQEEDLGELPRSNTDQK